MQRPEGFSERQTITMSDMMRGKSGYDAVLGICVRRRWLALSILAAGLTASGSLAVFLPNVYSATATVLVERRTVTESLVRPAMSDEVETRLRTISEEVLSRPRLQELISRLQLYPEMRAKGASEEAVIERLRRDIRQDLRSGAAAGGSGTTIAFALTYRGRDPRTVAEVANRLASMYVEENVRSREQQAAGATDFLKAQLEESRANLEEQERRLGRYKEAHTGELPEQVEANLSTLDRLNTQLQLNDAARGRLVERREVLRGQGATSGPGGALETPAERLDRLRAEQAHLLTQYTDRHPDVIRLEAEIAALERQLAAQPPAASGGRPKSVGTAGSRPIPVASSHDGAGDNAGPAIRRPKETLAGTGTDMESLGREEKKLRAAIAEYERRVENAPRREQELKAMSREYDTDKERYLSLLKRYEEARLNESMEKRQQGEQFRILEPAVVPDRPAAPNRLQLLLGGWIVAIVLAAGAILAAERLDTSFHSADDLRAFTRVPVLVSIPSIVTQEDIRRGRRRACVAAVLAAFCLLLVAGTSYVAARSGEPLVRMLAGKVSSEVKP